MINRPLEEILLSNFDLDEILEMNDISEEEVIRILFNMGLISEPENLIREFEVDE